MYLCVYVVSFVNKLGL